MLKISIDDIPIEDVGHLIVACEAVIEAINDDDGLINTYKKIKEILIKILERTIQKNPEYFLEKKPINKELLQTVKSKMFNLKNNFN